MKSYTVTRDGDRDLAFTGELIGSASSRNRGRSRWFEVRIYRTEIGHFVVNGIGRSVIEGESDRSWAVVARTGEDVIAALQRDEMQCADCRNEYAAPRGACERCGSTKREPSGAKFLTKTANEAITHAAARDAAIADAFVQRVA